jgi:hypothetical protein
LGPFSFLPFIHSSFILLVGDFHCYVTAAKARGGGIPAGAPSSTVLQSNNIWIKTRKYFEICVFDKFYLFKFVVNFC